MRTTIRVSPKAYEFLEKLSEETGLTFSEIASTAILNMDKVITITEKQVSKKFIEIH